MDSDGGRMRLMGWVVAGCWLLAADCLCQIVWWNTKETALWRGPGDILGRVTPSMPSTRVYGVCAIVHQDDLRYIYIYIHSCIYGTTQDK